MGCRDRSCFSKSTVYSRFVIAARIVRRLVLLCTQYLEDACELLLCRHSSLAHFIQFSS